MGYLFHVRGPTASLLPSFGPSQNTCYYGAVKSLEYLFSPDDASFLAVDIMVSFGNE